MKRIEIGQHLKTNYSSGTMRVLSIIRGCTCAHVVNDMNTRPQLGEVAAPLPPHLHMCLRYTDQAPKHLRGEQAWLGYYDETTLRSYDPGGKPGRDRVTLLENPIPIQRSFAL